MTEKDINIRSASENDIDQLKELYLKLRKEIMNVDDSSARNMMKAYIKKRLNQENYFIYLAEVKGVIVGTIAFQIKGKKTAVIIDAYTKPEFRRKGILKALEQKVIKYIKNKDIQTINLTVRINNEQAQAAWSSLGYKTIMEVKRKLIN